MTGKWEVKRLKREVLTEFWGARSNTIPRESAVFYTWREAFDYAQREASKVGQFTATDIPADFLITSTTVLDAAMVQAMKPIVQRIHDTAYRAKTRRRNRRRK